MFASPMRAGFGRKLYNVVPKTQMNWKRTFKTSRMLWRNHMWGPKLFAGDAICSGTAAYPISFKIVRSTNPSARC